MARHPQQKPLVWQSWACRKTPITNKFLLLLQQLLFKRSLEVKPPTIRRPGSACTVFLSYVESKICTKIQNPKSEIQNPKSKIRNPNPKFGQKDLLHNVPKSKIQNPKSEIQNPKSKTRNPKSKIQNPKSEIQNPKSPAKIQNLGRWGPHKKNCYITIQNPKSPKSGQKSLDFGFWIWGILDFGFRILDFGFQGMCH